MDTSTPPGTGLPPTAPGATPAAPGAGFFDGVRRTGLLRSEERWVGGVAGGLGLRFGVDPLVPRGLFAVSVLFGGIGLVLYGLGWALLPEQRDGRIHFQELLRGAFDVALVGALLTFVVGVSSPDGWNPWVWWSGSAPGLQWLNGLLWLAAVGVVIALVVGSRSGRRAGPTAPVPPTSAPPPGGAPRTEGPAMSTEHRTATTPAAPGGQPTATAAAAPDAGPASAYPPPPGGWSAGSRAGWSGHGAPGAPGWHGGPGSHTAHAGFGPGAPTGPGGPGGPGRPWPASARPGPPAALPRRRASGPGAVTVGLVGGLTLLTLAALLYLDRTGDVDGPVWLVAGAVAVLLAGLGIVVAGLRGRTSGGLGGFAVLVILAVAPLLALDRSTWYWADAGTAVGELVQTPRSVAEAEAGFSLGAGEARIDLTEVPPSDEPVEVPISVGAGDLTLIVPEDGAYTAEARVMAGQIDWLGDEMRRAGGMGRQATLESDAVREGAAPDLVLDIRVGAGQLRVVEE